VHDEALTIAPMCISNEDSSPFAINGCNTTARPSGFAQIVSDDWADFCFSRL
jgi:sarcosine oxidase delta subunit